MAASTTSNTESSVHTEVSFGPEDRGPSGEGLANGPGVSVSASYSPDELFAALRATKTKRFAEYVPGPQCATILKDVRVLKVSKRARYL